MKHHISTDRIKLLKKIYFGSLCCFTTSLLVELLMSSRGHFLLIRVSIYQNECIHE